MTDKDELSTRGCAVAPLRLRQAASIVEKEARPEMDGRSSGKRLASTIVTSSRLAPAHDVNLNIRDKNLARAITFSPMENEVEKPYHEVAQITDALKGMDIIDCSNMAVDHQDAC